MNPEDFLIIENVPIPKPRFPGGSKKRVSKAGDAIRAGCADPTDFKVIDEWRAAHRHVINTFQALLRTRTRDTDIVVAQRHKRRRTIFDKLHRYPGMALARMDDVAGCRLIFPNLDEMYDFRRRFHRGRFHHRLKNTVDKWDYVQRPKNTGYRGIHDVYEYDATSFKGFDYQGLLIELQYRTEAQHAWATCVEVIGFITESQPKFEKGDARYLRAMALASELLARFTEGKTSCLPGLSDREVLTEFDVLDREIQLMSLLRSLHSSRQALEPQNDMILIYSEEDEPEVRYYPHARAALAELFQLERDNPGRDLVLVRADKSDDVRNAFRNYFKDVRHFLELMDAGCQETRRG